MRNWRTMAVFLGPRHTTAEEREGRRRAREMAWREAIFSDGGGWGAVVWPFVGEGCDCEIVFASLVVVVEGRGVGTGGRVCEGCTSQGSHPPGAWVIFAFSKPRRRGIDGPVRSMSRMPTDLPAKDRERASWVVMEDLPTPPLPDKTYRSSVSKVGYVVGTWNLRE